MSRFAFLLALLLCALAPVQPAQALSSRTFVSGFGNDSNSCTLAAPCRTIQRAATVTATDGTIVALDPAGYGSFAVGAGITIEGNGWAQISPASGGAGIVASQFSGTVVLHGLLIDGQGAGTDGIAWTGAGRVEIIDCVIRNFRHDGIYLNIGNVGGINAITNFLIVNTVVTGNGSSGVEVAPVNPFTARGALERLTATNNTGAGILIDATHTGGGAFVDVSITNSISEDNTGDGVTAMGVGDEKVEIKSSTMSNNGGNGLTVNNAKVGISKSALIMNAAGFSITNSGTVNTFSDNFVDNNRGANTGTLTPIAPQ
jgi:hypothetical protein